MSQPRARIAIIGGGPGGYEAALVAAQLGAEVTVVERDGLGGACVLTDCVPSKTLIATSGMMAALEGSASLGIRLNAERNGAASSMHPACTPGSGRWPGRSPPTSHRGCRPRASRSSPEPARLVGPRTVAVGDAEIEADAVLIATGAEPRILPGAEPDGERILTWRQLYDLDALPAELIVVGSGVTGAEFASAYQALGSQVTLVSSRERVLPHEDADAAMVVEDVFRRRGMTVLGQSRAERVSRTGDGVSVSAVSDGRTVRGTHCLLTVGMVPSTSRSRPGRGRA